MIEKEKSFAHMEDLIPLITECLSKGQTVTISPRGVSMLPMIRQDKDSVCLSSPPQRLKKYDIPLYKRQNGQYVLHRVVRVGRTYTCIGDNQFVYEKGIEHDQIIAVCTSVTRNGKEYSVNALRWRLYAIFWHYSRFPRRVFRAVMRRIFKRK